MYTSVFVTGLLTAVTFFVSATTITHAEAAEVQQSKQHIIVEVKPGDNLSKIASKYQTTYKRLFDANSFIQDPNVIHPGSRIRIPHNDERLTSRLIKTSFKRQNYVNSRHKLTTAKQQFTKTKSRQLANKRQQTNKLASVIVDGSVWDKLAACESGGRWDINTGNGYYGGLQFKASTWRAVGGSGLPHQASREEQISKAQILQARSGWGQWPACSAKLGLR